MWVFFYHEIPATTALAECYLYELSYPIYFNLLACGCKGVDKICNPQTGECNCPANFQGRVCDACQCNGNSNKCQRDGKCLDCHSNTFGDHCEMCKPSFYGDALKGDCKGTSIVFIVHNILA